MANSAMTVNNGGVLAGAGGVGSVKVNSGSTFAPGNSGAPGTGMTVSGNLAFASGGVYLAQLNPSASTSATVSGTATVTGATVDALFMPGSYIPKRYDVLNAGNISGTFSETDVTGGGLGLSYGAQSATDTRTELGARFDDPALVGGIPVLLRGRLAWAHDFVSNPALSAAFETLPGSNFIVNGAAIPHYLALTTAGAEIFFTPRWSLLVKFDGDFAPTSQTYAGSGTLRYRW